MSDPNHGRSGVLALVAAFSFAAAFDAAADTVSTSFETEPPGDFTIGTSPITAQFRNGNAMTVGNPALYQSGTHSWHVSAGVTGVIEFETPASEVDFWFRDAAGGGPSVARVIDVNDAVVSQTTGSQSFQNVTVTRAQGETLIARVELEHQGAAGAADVVMDDFTFTAEAGGMGGQPLDDPIPAAIPQGDVTIQLVEVASGLTAPNWGIYAPNDPTRLFVVDQTGIVYAIDLATGGASVFLDVSARLVALGIGGPGTFDERGLLGLAFHPDYGNNGLLYTYTSEPVDGAADFSTMPPGIEADHQSVIAEWAVAAPGDPNDTVDPASRRELLRIDQPQFNHNAGGLEFSQDGYLLISLGDGGGADDEDGQPFMGTPMVGHGDGNGKDPSNPLGTLLRIDPLGNDSANGSYGIPPSNPFVGMMGFVDEIFAYGFRNPFRFSVDRMNGDIWVADVGQNDIEEVDVVTAGGNFGWNYKEGSFFFDPNGVEDGFVTDEDPGVPPDLVDPLAEYDHDEGVAIIGGFVYRGSRIPALAGRYIFGDFGAQVGRLFYLDANDEIQEFQIMGRADLGAFLDGFGLDADGNIYVLTNTTGTPSGDTGKVYRIDSTPGVVQFAMTDISVSEGGDATVSVERTDGLFGAASVDYATADGTATEGSDYTAASGTLSWMDGETGAKEFTVAITDDMDNEGAETIEVTLSNAMGAQLGASAAATITIGASDQPPPSGGGGGGATSWLLALLLLPLAFLQKAALMLATRRARARRPGRTPGGAPSAS